jgi:monoamine oxidase
VDADAIVIGAGAAGLAAARSLGQRSLRVILLEARDRVGGRVWSAPSTPAAVPVELGAEFIHGPAVETRALLREAGIDAIDTRGDAWTWREGEEPRREDRDWLASASILERARTLAADESVDQFLRRFDGDETMRETVALARAFVEGFDAADPAVASAQAIADELRSGVDFASARPLGGYGPMIERLRDASTAAGVATNLSTVVRRISWRHGAVEVDIQDASGHLRTLRARTALVTIPAGVLRDSAAQGAIVFDPGLPAAKRAALASIETGQVIKINLVFRTPFWERLRDGRYGEAAFFRSPEQSFPGYWTQFPVRSNLIVAWAGGPKATALGGATEAELTRRALDEFGKIVGEPGVARNEFEGGVMHDWDRDPFACGAYSYVVVGGGDARAVLAAPIDDTLFFAGEATSGGGQSGTVNGALATGERAAREIATSLGVTAR